MLKLAYIGAHLGSYLADEYDVFQRSIAGLKVLSQQLNFELSSHIHISSREEARRAAEACEAQAIDLVLFQHSSFVMGDLTLEFAERDFHLALWATDEPRKEGAIPLNNFVSMNLQAGIMSRYLKNLERPFKWFYGMPEQPWFIERLTPTLKALAAIQRLKQARVGLVGGLAPTFLNILIDERQLRQILGTEVGHHELAELFSLVDAQEKKSIQKTAEAMSALVGGQLEISEHDLQQSAAVYLGLKAMAENYGYDALAVSDWPVFQSTLKLHPGMAFSYMDEHLGIPVASEGDILGAVSMLMMNTVNQDQSLLLDINDLDLEREAVLMWHCGGSPLGFADAQGVRWTNHTTLGRKSNQPPMGAVADYRFAPQPVTILRLGSDAKDLLILEAEVIASPHAGFDGSRGWLSNFHFDGQAISLKDLVNTIMVEGIEHHFILGKGHHSEALHELAAWLGLDIIRPVPYRNYLQRFSRR